MSSGLLTEEQVRSYLNIETTELSHLVQKGKLTAYKVGGAYVRYQKEEVMALKGGRKFRNPNVYERTWWDKIIDFLKFYGFYILLSGMVIAFIAIFLKV